MSLAKKVIHLRLKSAMKILTKRIEIEQDNKCMELVEAFQEIKLAELELNQMNPAKLLNPN